MYRQTCFFFIIIILVFTVLQASLRTARNLKSCRNTDSVNNDKLKSQVAEDVIKGMGVVAEHPLGF